MVRFGGAHAVFPESITQLPTPTEEERATYKAARGAATKAAYRRRTKHLDIDANLHAFLTETKSKQHITGGLAHIVRDAAVLLA